MDAPRLLGEWRRAKGLSQLACAKLMGVSQPAYNAWEKGRGNPHVEFALKMEEVTEGYVPCSAWRKAPPATGTDG